ncbi:unnamed protein product [Orchesella dallaii]|uniref:Uncharacterized protein n=1 Tax=Orchesella dallaii TaxID=48710 RepID=A0ABP1RYM8_9HEXA
MFMMMEVNKYKCRLGWMAAKMDLDSGFPTGFSKLVDDTFMCCVGPFRYILDTEIKDLLNLEQNERETFRMKALKWKYIGFALQIFSFVIHTAELLGEMSSSRLVIL